MRTWLRDLRTVKSLSQEQVANAAGITRAYYTKIENNNAGKVMPSVPVAKRIAGFLNCEWERFYDQSEL